MPSGLKIGEWVDGLPTEPGAYLLYGGFLASDGVVYRPSFFIGKARYNAIGKLMCVGDGKILFPEDVSLKHASFVCDLPSAKGSE